MESADKLSELTDEDIRARHRELAAELQEIQARRDEIWAGMEVLRDEQALRTRRAAAARGDNYVMPTAQTKARAAASRLSQFSLPVNRPAINTPVKVPDPKPRGESVIRVSDHAVVRYLERVQGVDVEAIRQQILSPVVRAALANGVANVRTADYMVVSKEGTVTTILPNDAGPTKRSHHKVRISMADPLDRGPRLEDWENEDE